MPQFLIYFNCCLLKKSPDYSIRANSAVADYGIRDSNAAKVLLISIPVRKPANYILHITTEIDYS